MNNPFTSKLFTSTWLTYFERQKAETSFDFIKNLTFYKHHTFPFYVNVGKNLTKGLDYEIDYAAKDYKNKVCLIYDVPEYFQLDELDIKNTKIRCKKVFQYKGFALDFKDFETPDDYIASRISSKNRRGYRSRLKRLEACFDIRYSFLFGQTDRTEYDHLFQQFHDLLSKRFIEKEMDYHHLEPKKWEFYTELVYKMIQEKKASLFVIYNGDKPIGVTLNFHSDEIAFVTITVFDPDYYKFNVGKASIVKLLEWCYEQGIKIMDLSKGAFDFKYEWCNLVYQFDYHILYDSQSIKSRITARLLVQYFKTKLYLRKKGANQWYRKQLHKMKSGKQEQLDFSKLQLEYVENSNITDAIVKLDMDDPKNDKMKKFLYSFLFLNPEPEHDVTLFEDPSAKCHFIQGKDKTQKISFKS
jgi:hypothetical protein